MISFDNGETFFDEKDLIWSGDYSKLDGKNRGFKVVDTYFPSPYNRETAPKGYQYIGVRPFDDLPNVLVPYWRIVDAMIETDREGVQELYESNPDLNAKEFLIEFGKTHTIVME